jgi:transcriptional regulator with XRE-family HTH domain
MPVSSHAVEMPWTTRHLGETIRRQMADYRQEVGARLRRLREGKGWNQADAAHEVGVGPKTWHLWETGKTTPYERNWRKIGEIFDVDPVDIRGVAPTPLGLGNDNGSESTDFSEQLDELLTRLAGLEEQVRLVRAEMAAHDAEELKRNAAVLRAIRESR